MNCSNYWTHKLMLYISIVSIILRTKKFHVILALKKLLISLIMQYFIWAKTRNESPISLMKLAVNIKPLNADVSPNNVMTQYSLCWNLMELKFKKFWKLMMCHIATNVTWLIFDVNSAIISNVWNVKASVIKILNNFC